MNVWILSNERAGRSLSNDRLRELVEREGHTVTDVVNRDHETPAPPHDDIDAIVAAGGDGTIRAAANLVIGTSTPIAVLPLGTANNIATSLAMPTDLTQLIASWHDNRRMALDVGHFSDGSRERLVIEGIGGGFVPAGIAAAQDALSATHATPSGELAAALKIFRKVLTDLPPVRRTIALDGTIIDKELLMFEVLNMRSVGPSLVLAPDADPSDGQFDVVIAAPSHRRDLVAYLDARIAGDDPRLSLPCYRARHVYIGACEEFHVDDERVESCTPGDVEISVTAGAVTLLI